MNSARRQKAKAPDASPFLRHCAESWRVFRQSFRPLFLLTIITVGPVHVLRAAIGPNVLSGSVDVSLAVMAIGGLFALWQAGACIAWLEERDRQGGGRLSRALARGGRAWLSMLILNLDVGARILIGLVLFIVPGIRAAVRYAFAVYVLICEDKVARQARERSAQLAGGRWRYVLFGGGAVSIAASALSWAVSGLGESTGLGIVAAALGMASEIPLLYGLVWFMLLFEERRTLSQ